MNYYTLYCNKISSQILIEKYKFIEKSNIFIF